MKKQIIIIGAICLFCTLLISGCNEQKKPIISSFEILPNEIELGQTSKLFWVVSDAASVTIDNGIGIVPLSGNLTITPTETTTYTISAKSSTTTVTSTVQIIVIKPGEEFNITVIQTELYVEITETKNVRINQSQVSIIAINKNSGENQTLTLGPILTDGDSDPEILGIGDIITFRNLTDFDVGEQWTIQIIYDDDIIGQCTFKNPSGPYYTPSLRMAQSGSSVRIIAIINGPIEQDHCSFKALNISSGINQATEMGVMITDNDNNPTFLSVGDNITFQNLNKFRSGDQWTIQLEYKGNIIGQCIFTNQGEMIIIP